MSKYCLRCGKELPEKRRVRFCPQCSKASACRVSKNTNLIEKCVYCGEKLAPKDKHKKGPKSKYCPGCKSKYESQLPKAKYEYVCKNCGITYPAKKKERNQFHSRECFFEYISKNKQENNKQEKTKIIIIKYCIRCGEETQLGVQAKYCRDCRKVIDNNKSRERCKKNFEIHKSPGHCEYCGDEYLPIYGNWDKKYCPDCRKKVRSLKKHEENIKRKLKEAKQFVARVDRLAIFKRDQWICQICGQPVDPKIKHPDKWSASIDHIIPLARGGSHEPNNVQLAHMICNSYKRDLDMLDRSTNGLSWSLK